MKTVSSPSTSALVRKTPRGIAGPLVLFADRSTILLCATGLQCDVCKRDVATGGLRLVGGREGEKFECTVEVLCTHCEGRYMRCSDCGGGGGTRG